MAIGTMLAAISLTGLISTSMAAYGVRTLAAAGGPRYPVPALSAETLIPAGIAVAGIVITGTLIWRVAVGYTEGRRDHKALEARVAILEQRFDGTITSLQNSIDQLKAMVRETT